MQNYPTEITFFESLIPLILSGKKVITIRDKSENNYKVGSIISLFANEHRTYYGKLQILSVHPLQYSEIDEFHAQQEGMCLLDLQQLIKKIYPTTESLYLIEFQLLV